MIRLGTRMDVLRVIICRGMYNMDDGNTWLILNNLLCNINV